MHIHNKTSKFFSLVLSVAIMLASASVLSLSASAVSYEGKGTKKSPYIVKTVEQLKGMADKPSAYYTRRPTPTESGKVTTSTQKQEKNVKKSWRK